MNERIKELALQAGFAYEPIKDQLWVGPPIEIMISPGLEKFAQLIVKECIDINQQELSFNAFERLMNRYQKQFGVEL